MKSRSWPAVLAIIGLLAIACGAYRAVTRVPYTDVATRFEITGRFGQPLGKIILLEGEVLGDDAYSKGRDPSKALIRVTKLDGTALERPIDIECRLRDKPQAGQHVRLLGFETGGMAGISDDHFKWYESHGGVPQTQSWHFAVDFIVLEPDQRPLPPAPRITPQSR